MVVVIKNKKGKVWHYENKKNETLILDAQIKDDMAKICKQKRINKSKLVEEFYKTIILRMKDGSLNATNGYITLNILQPSLMKNKTIREPLY